MAQQQRLEILRPISLACLAEHKEGMAIMGLFARRNTQERPLLLVSIEPAAAPDRVLLMTAVRAWSRVLIEPRDGYARAIEWQRFEGEEEDESDRGVDVFFESITLKRTESRTPPVLRLITRMGFHPLSGSTTPLPAQLSHLCKHGQYLEEFAEGSTKQLTVPIYRTRAEWLASWRDTPFDWQLALRPRLIAQTLIPALGDGFTMRSLWWMAYWMSGPSTTAVYEQLLRAHDRLIFLATTHDDLLRAWRAIFDAASLTVKWIVVATLMRRALDEAAMGHAGAHRVSLAFSLHPNTLLGQLMINTAESDEREHAFLALGLGSGLLTPGHRWVVHLVRRPTTPTPPVATSARFAPVTRFIQTTAEEQWRANVLFETYARPLIRERAQTCLVLEWEGRDEARLSFCALYTPGEDSTQTLRTMTADQIALFIPRVGCDLNSTTRAWPVHWWAHVMVLNAHRMDGDSLLILQAYVGAQRLLNGQSIDHGTFVLAGCPSFEYAQGYGGWRERSGITVHETDDLMRPPSVETCDAIRQLLANKAQGTIRIEVEEKKGKQYHVKRAFLPASSRSRLYSTIMNNTGDCGGGAGPAGGLCPRIRRATRFLMFEPAKRMLSAGCDLDHQRAWTELPPGLLDERFGAALRQLAMMEWRLVVTEASLYWMTRDQLLWLVDFAAREPRARIILSLKPATSSSIPEEARESPSAVLIFMLARMGCRPTLNWTAKD